MGFRAIKPGEEEIEVANSPSIEELCEEGEQRLDEIVEEVKEEEAERLAAIYTILFGLIVFTITSYYFWNFINEG